MFFLCFQIEGGGGDVFAVSFFEGDEDTFFSCSGKTDVEETTFLFQILRAYLMCIGGEFSVHQIHKDDPVEFQTFDAVNRVKVNISFALRMDEGVHFLQKIRDRFIFTEGEDAFREIA